MNGILFPKKDIQQPQVPEKIEKAGLLASMLLEKKESQQPATTMVNGELEQYKKLNGNKRPASTEPLDESTMPKKPHIEQPSNGSSASNGVSIGAATNSISVPAGSSISTTAGGQKVITTPDGKKMIISQDTNGTPMIIGTIEATPATPSPPPPPSAANTMTTSPVPPQQTGNVATSTASGTIVALVGGQHSPANSPRPLVNGQVNGNSSSSLSSPESPKSTSPASTSATSSALSPTTTATPTSSFSVTTVPKPNPALPFLCEWKGCMKAFKTAKEVEKHAISTHCPLGSDDIPCLWNRCDSMKRKRFSLMTHLQDRHCHPQVCCNSKQTTDIIILQ